MALHIPTMLLLLAAICGGGAAACWISWWSGDRSQPLAWWGSAFASGAVGCSLLAFQATLPVLLGIDLANAAVLLCYGLAFGGACVFDGRRSPLPIVFGGAALWLVACRIEGFHESGVARTAVASTLGAAYAFALAREFARGGRDSLRLRRILVGACALIGLTFVLRGLGLLLATTPDLLVHAGAAEGMLLFIPIPVVFATVFLGLSLSRDRTESALRRLAALDSLTGVLNRGAFMAKAEKVLQRAKVDGRPVSLVLFDLDRFKHINDRYGHPTGDEILRLFVEGAEDALRPSDLIGRIGGEEFAVLLAGTGPDDARRVADRIRVAFAGQKVEVRGEVAATTVSAGVASARRRETLDRLFVQADAALYAAKNAGRNRVEVAREEESVLRPIAGGRGRRGSSAA